VSPDECSAIQEAAGSGGESQTSHENQEGEWEYWAHMNFATKTIAADPETLWAAFSDDKAKLRRQGWKFSMEDTCYTALEATLTEGATDD
jgi:hypothetical protein